MAYRLETGHCKLFVSDTIKRINRLVALIEASGFQRNPIAGIQIVYLCRFASVVHIWDRLNRENSDALRSECRKRVLQARKSNQLSACSALARVALHHKRLLILQFRGRLFRGTVGAPSPVYGAETPRVWKTLSNQLSYLNGECGFGFPICQRS